GPGRRGARPRSRRSARRRPPSPPCRPGPRASVAAATEGASRAARARRDTGRETPPAPPAPGAGRPARTGPDRRASSARQGHRRLERPFLAGGDVQAPYQQERGALIDPLEAALGERHRLDRTPAELRSGAPPKARLDGGPLVDQGHRREVRRASRAAERGPGREVEIPIGRVAGRKREIPLDRPAT